MDVRVGIAAFLSLTAAWAFLTALASALTAAWAFLTALASALTAAWALLTALASALFDFLPAGSAISAAGREAEAQA